ncbi:immunoglobulin-like domain-containing protein [Aliarcobacter butzleri]|uniref:immunoglobulin-like domain-containing protein n=1 Tax=Aliarcobacter butzleri TaxID=28197 RepID=UPI003AF7F2F5
MKEVIGKVVKIEEGVFSVKGANGNIKTLSTGDEIFKDEIVQGEAINTDLSALDVKLVNGEIFFLNGTQEQKFDSSLLDVVKLNEEVAFNEEDITALMETASGEVEEEKEEQDGNSFKAVFYIRDGALTNVESDLRDKLFTSSEKQEDLENKLILEERPVEVKEVPLPTPTKIILTGSEVIEGEDITVTATVDNAPQTDLVITLSNNEIITIKAGELTGTVTYNSRADDKYIQGDEIENITIKKINYQNIDTTSTATVTIKDDEDVTNVSITKTQKISYEIENIEALETTSKTSKSNEVDYTVKKNVIEGDEYIEGNIPEISIVPDKEFIFKDGYYYLKLDVSILSNPLNEALGVGVGGGIFSNLNRSFDLKFNPGETHKTLDIFFTEDEYKNIISQEISSYSTGGDDTYLMGGINFSSTIFTLENSKYSFKEIGADNITLTNIKTTQANIKANIVGDNVEFNIELSNKPFNIDIDGNGVADTKWYATVVINKVEHTVLIDENGKGTLVLDTKSFNSNTITADITAIKESVSADMLKYPFSFKDVSYGSTTIILDKEVTYEIETSNIPDPTKYDFVTTFPTVKVEVQKDITKDTYIVNLDKNGKGTLTLDTTGLTKEPIIKVLEVNGNFENVDLFNINHKENQTEIIGKTTTITPTKIELTGSEVIEGENITVTATVDNAPQTDLVITLSNNEIITIKSGELTGTIAFKNPYADDIYKQGDRALDLSIKSTTGGEYKILDTNAKAKVIVKDDADVTNVSVSKIIIPETIDIESSSKTTQNTGKSDEAYFPKWKNNKPSLALNKFKPTGQNVVNDEDLTVKDFYIKDGEVKRDSLGNMFVEIVLVLKNPAKYDMEFSVDQKSYFTIKAGETTGTTKYDYFAKNVPDDVYKQGATFVNFGIDLEKVDGKQIVLRDYFNTNVSKTLIDNEIINFEAEFKGDGYIDTTTANLDYKDNLDGTVTIKIELSNPTKLMSDVYYGYIDVLINGKIERIELSKEQEYFLTVDKQFKDGKFNVGIQKVFSMYEDVSHASTITIEEGYQKFEIETSNIPDPTKYDFVNTFPTATVEVQKDITKETYTINLDKNGKGTITLDTTGLTKEPIIKVVEVDGNFEEINVFDKKSLNLNMNFEDDNIDLSNLNAIIEDKQLNLKNGVENKLLNISLEDVLKLAPEKSITIHGDEFDKVTFKDTLASDGTQNNWSKTAGTGTDSGYDVYTNSGDELLKVKVEQPISDGITS